MRLTILGNQGPFPGIGGACSGYLLSDKRTEVLMDCGSGVLSNLQRFCKIEDLDAIILSHLHHDHMGDMLILIYALKIKLKKGELDRKIKVYTPNSPIDVFETLANSGVFECIPIENNQNISINNLNISFRIMTHPEKTMAVSVFNGKKRFVFSGDSSFNDDIVDFSRNADLIMLDSNLLNTERDENSSKLHMTASECGRVARLSGAKRLLLTHLLPGIDAREYVEEAKTEYHEAYATVILGQYEI